MKNEKKLSLSFNFTFCYIDGVFSISNSKFGDFVDRLYSVEIEIKDIIETIMSASYIDLQTEINSEGLLRTKIITTKETFVIISHCELYSYM